jgi:AAHS family benzoate transporter-like MFS transporter
MGRVGAIVGPVLGGLLLAAELPMALNFLAFSIPGLVSVLATALYMVSRRQQRSREAYALAA